MWRKRSSRSGDLTKHEAKAIAKRLLAEARLLRMNLAALRAQAGKRTSNLYLLAAAPALQGDLMIRLVRVFDRDARVSSFWRLNDFLACGSIDIETARKLKGFSKRLKHIRDKAFVHIDRDHVADSRRPYRDVNIQWSEIESAIEALWTFATRAYQDLYGTPFRGAGLPFESLVKDFQRDWSKLERSCHAD
jgi:AbiU2